MNQAKPFLSDKMNEITIYLCKVHNRNLFGHFCLWFKRTVKHIDKNNTFIYYLSVCIHVFVDIARV